MQIVNFPTTGYNQIGASGDCPHCTVRSYFRPVANYSEPITGASTVTLVSAAQCESCKNFVLVVGRRSGPQATPLSLFAVFPLGKPKDQVADEVPQEISDDFKEALRCHWIDAYKACVVMCARSIQASAIGLGAKGSRLIDQIDDLFKNGKITESLKDFAHVVRLTRNVGAHPDKDGLKDVSKEDADDIIEFTREFLHHVYVMPAKLEVRKGKPKPVTQPGTVAGQ